MNAPFGMARGAAYDHLLVAINSVPHRRLDAIVPLVYKAHLAGQLDEAQTDRLQTAAQVRRDVFAARRRVGNHKPLSPPNPAHSRSRSRANRRIWGGSGALPPSLRSQFTPGENAVAAVIRAEVRRNGSCSLPYAQIAKSAGLLSTTVVKRFVRLAKASGLIAVKERRVTGGRNAPNVITITSTEWRRWNDLSVSEWGGGTSVPPYQNRDFNKRSTKARSSRLASGEVAKGSGMGTGGKVGGHNEGNHEQMSSTQRTRSPHSEWAAGPSGGRA